MLDSSVNITSKTVTEVLDITAANFPCAASVFPVTRASITDGTDNDDTANIDVVSGLTTPLSASSPAFDATTETISFGGTGVPPNAAWIDNFHQSNAAVKALLDGPSASSPIMFVLSLQWTGTQEAYGRSMGYGDWKGDVNDFLYIGATSVEPNDDLWTDNKIDGKSLQATYTDGLNPEMSGGTIITPVWHSHLVCIDPLESRTTMYSVKEGSTTVVTQTGTALPLTNPFTFGATSYQLTLHKGKLAFMGLFYPDVLPSPSEAHHIVTDHYNNHSNKVKKLHPWFNNRPKYA